MPCSWEQGSEQGGSCKALAEKRIHKSSLADSSEVLLLSVKTVHF